MRKLRTIHEVIVRRCSLSRNRFRWMIAAPDGVSFRHSLISFSTEAAAREAGNEMVFKLDSVQPARLVSAATFRLAMSDNELA